MELTMKAAGRRATLAFLVLMMAAVAAQGAAPKPDPFPLPAAALADKGLQVLWQTELSLDKEPPLADLWLCGKFVVGRAADNRLFAINAGTGVRLWSQQVAEPFQKVWQPAVDKDTLWVATTTKLLGIEGLDGKRLQAIDLDFSPAGRLVTNGAHVFIPDAKGWLQAVSVLHRGVSWGRWTDDAVTAAPTLDSSLVYFGSQSGVVYASTQNIRRIQWEHQTEAAIVADLQHTKTGLVLVASLDYTLYAFAGPSGRVAWKYNAGEPLRKTPYAAGNQVFVSTPEAGLTALDATSGKVQWALADGADFVSADPETVYVISRSGRLLAVSRTDGKVKFDFAPKPGTLVAVNATDSGIVYLATSGGAIMAIARKGLPAEEKKPEPAETPAPAPPGNKKPPTADTKKPAGDETKPPEAKEPPAPAPAQ
jgi:outer membrane protein assembly factor BamB